MDLNESFSSVEEKETPESSQERNTSSWKKLIERDCQIGYLKNSYFNPVTNFAVKCTGYVVDDRLSKSANGFLVQVIQKTDLVDGTETEELQRPSYYLTWKDMSTQYGILSAFSSQKLWTAPSKEQYLPLYMKELCENYMKSDSPHRVLPVKCIGLQNESNPPTWVLGMDLQISLEDGISKRVPEDQSLYRVLGDVNESKLPAIFDHIGELDSGESLVNLIATMKKFMGKNFQPSLLVIGGLVMAVHYDQLMNIYGDGVPLIMAYGYPVTGKSTAVDAAMAIIGQRDNIGECTVAGALNMICEQTLPFWWDDANNFSVLEKLALAAFNKSKKKTGKVQKQSEVTAEPRTVPLITMNPQTLPKGVKNDAEKLSRVFTRVAVIPFGLIETGQSLEKSMAMQKEMKPILNNVVKSVGKVLELSFVEMLEDELFKEIITTKEIEDLDLRSSKNFSMLLYSTGKLLANIGVKDIYFPELKSWVADVLVPHQKALLTPTSTHEGGLSQAVGDTETKQPSTSQMVPQALHPMEQVIYNLLEAATKDPNKVKTFFNPKFSVRKCGCGEVFGFNVGDSLAYLKLVKEDTALRSFIRKNEIGCNGKKINVLNGQRLGSHIKRSAIRIDVLYELDKAYGYDKPKGQLNEESPEISGPSSNENSTLPFSNSNTKSLAAIPANKIPSNAIVTEEQTNTGPPNEELQKLSGPSSNEKLSTLLFSDNNTKSLAAIPANKIPSNAIIIEEQTNTGPFNEELQQLSGPSSSENSSTLPFSDDNTKSLAAIPENKISITNAIVIEEQANTEKCPTTGKMKRQAQDPLKDALGQYFTPKDEIRNPPKRKK